jgi:tyrosine phenol-lyase
LPTHQGRASERILVETLIGSPPAGQGMIVPNNAHFDTTRANVEHSGAKAVDILTEEGRAASVAAPFKGNMDPKQLRDLLNDRADDVPMVMLTITCNTNGGQPVSLANLHEIRSICDEFDKPLILDAARFAENAWLIKMREPGQAGRDVREIAREVFELSDGATISAKKDGLVNIGGVLLLRDESLFVRASDLLILTEGYVTYGGLAGRDLEAMAIGLNEVLEEDYLQYRVRSVEYLGDRLAAAGVRIVQPPGGHAIYMDACDFLPDVPRSCFPGQALACAMYEHAGIRSCEIGSVMMGEHAVMELVRMAIPRRTYTQSHIDYVIEAVLEVKAKAAQWPGYRIVEQSGSLRHFTARFEPVPV